MSNMGWHTRDMAEDIGESLVGAYLRYVENCEFVLFNTFLPGEQGEIDVIGIRLGKPRDIYVAEVTTHIEGMTTEVTNPPSRRSEGSWHAHRSSRKAISPRIATTLPCGVLESLLAR